ncbi:acyl-CoA synthetase (AMP-forming)/AMP-acid ligase II [Stackebrandtia albiflava]|uniref:Acyl-CoA synthetase (AMP-forming)/AMP-acid ligase II n=1 Tax=Stackebrandtia albiflava TaxID=406432 RepID=A0A562V104_9ACTN|nr:AMP-binding protein [Stackebrandtia albiflava]TWJ11493.1 acyl-CoA synthetase (AMP-forming)/AMP-acid ligase II [Stackebrandtia albiflava]
MDVTTLFDRAAVRFRDRVALEGPQGTQTFAELASRVARLAGVLRDMGLRPGDRVLDLQPNQNSVVEADLACMRAGLVRVALNYRLHTDDWDRIAADCEPAGLLCDASLATRAAGLYDRLPANLTIGGDHLERLERADPLTLPVYSDLVSLNYTSGTTGTPKGVRRHHRHRLTSMTNMTLDVLGGLPGPGDTYLHAGPISHTSGLFVLPFLTAGARQIIHTGFDTDAVLDAFTHRGVTHTALVPTMIARLLGSPDLEFQPGLKMLAYAGAPMSAAHIRGARERITGALVQYYGLVEAIPPVTVLTPEDHADAVDGRPELLASAGRAARLVDLAVVDEHGVPVPAGETGEVVTWGPHVMPGYWRGESDAKALRDGRLATGDLGRIGPDGHLWLVDRKADMILTGGYNVYPREVETLLAGVPGVDQVAVYGAEDPEWGQRVTAAYTGSATEAELRARCEAALAGFKRPKSYRRLTRFPLNATGKIDKKALARDDH